MRLRTRIAVILAGSLLILSGANAQRPAPGQIPNPNIGDGPGAERFWPAAPQVGDLFPDVSVVDNQGKPVNIRELPGENYSVIVLGCLT